MSLICASNQGPTIFQHESSHYFKHCLMNHEDLNKTALSCCSFLKQRRSNATSQICLLRTDEEPVKFLCYLP